MTKIKDISTSKERKSSNYPEQLKIAQQWNHFAENTNGIASGEFNLFYIDTKIHHHNHCTSIEGYRIVTNTIVLEHTLGLRERVFEEHTLVCCELKNVNKNFQIRKKQKFENVVNLFNGKAIQLDKDYILKTSDGQLKKRLIEDWKQLKIRAFAPFNLNIKYEAKTMMLKIKFLRMLKSENELAYLNKSINQFVKQIKSV